MTLKSGLASLLVVFFNYFVESTASDGKAMQNLKGAEAYQYLHSDKVGKVLIKELGNELVYLKADVEPSQSLHVSHHKAWVLSTMTGVVQTAGCSCIAGPGHSCSHAAAILWKVGLMLALVQSAVRCTHKLVSTVNCAGPELV